MDGAPEAAGARGARLGPRLRHDGPLVGWEAGYALANQGDIDTQAIGTCTHGSGLDLQSFSAALKRARLVTASGDVIEIGEDDPRLPALQTSVGMLGVMTEAEIQAVAAHRLVERIEHWHFDEAFGRLEDLARAHRHYSFFYIPTDALVNFWRLLRAVAARLGNNGVVPSLAGGDHDRYRRSARRRRG